MSDNGLQVLKGESDSVRGKTGLGELKREENSVGME